MNAHDRRIFIRAAARKGITTRLRPSPWVDFDVWAPFIGDWHIEEDTFRGAGPVLFARRIRATRYALNHAEQS